MAKVQRWTALRQFRQLVAARAHEETSDAELLERFVVRREEAAFVALLQRHGPMVLQVCRRVQGNAHDAEDVFQATFLLLARKAASIRKRDSVASWLHGVAHRLALAAKGQGARRRARERRAADMRKNSEGSDRSWQELQATLDEALRQVPEKYRAPLLLCYLQGQTQEEAARQLGCPLGTLRSRLARGRDRLRNVLERNGVRLSAPALAAALADSGASAALPAGLLYATTKAALAYAAGLAPAALVSARAAALLEGGLKAMTTAKLKTATAIILLVGALGLGGGALAGYVFARQEPMPGPAEPFAAATELPGPVLARPAAERADDPAGATFTYAGRILGPDGKPLAGAKVLIGGLTPGVIEFIEFRERAVSGSDGRFRFTVRRDEFGDKGIVPPGRSPGERYVHVGATADGCGAVGVPAGKAEERENLTLWLPAEEIVRARVVDLEGKPVAGVRVRAYVHTTRVGKDHKPLPFDAPSEAGQYSGIFLPFDEERSTGLTDKDGRCTLCGLSRGWLYDLRISGPTVVNANAELVTRPDPPKQVTAAGSWTPAEGEPKLTRYGSTFTFVVVPCKPIIGVVRERGTGKPVAGADVRTPFQRDDKPTASAKTDKHGRYELIGLPPGVHTLRVEPPPNMPYVATEVKVDASAPGIAPTTHDIEVERQPAVTGRVTDRATGKPIRGWVEYRPLAKSPNLAANPALAAPRVFGNRPPSARTDADGRFLLPVLRGPGVLLIRAEGVYLPAHLAKGDRVPGVADAADPELIDCRPFPAWPEEFHAYRLIDPKEGKDEDVAITLTPGNARPLVVEFPDGKARDTTGLGLKPLAQDRGEPCFPGTRAVAGLASDEARRLFLSTYDGELAAAAAVSGKDAGPVTLRLKPTGTITGRVVDQDGKPLRDVGFQLFFDDGPGRPGVFIHGGAVLRAPTPAESQRSSRTRGYSERGVRISLAKKTDEQGRFRITGVPPDLAFHLNAQLVGPPNAKGEQFITGEVKIARATVKPGETLDLGDLRAVAPPE